MQEDDVAAKIKSWICGPDVILDGYGITKPLKTGCQPHTQPPDFLAPAVPTRHRQSKATAGIYVPAAPSLGIKVLATSHLKLP